MKYINQFNSIQSAKDASLYSPALVSIIDGQNKAILHAMIGQQDNPLKINGDSINNLVIEEAGPSLISFTIMYYKGNNYGQTSTPNIYTPCIEQAEPNMTINQFIDSNYNPIVSGTTKKYQHTHTAGYGEWWDFNPGKWGDGSHLSESTVITNNMTVYYYSVSYCLLGDTEVTMSNGTIKQIKDIEVGDEVLSLDLATGEKVVRKVLYTDASENKSTTIWDEWIFEDGTIVKTAYRHEFYNVEAGKFKYMDEWQIGEHAYKLDGTTPMLVEHNVHEEVVNHYKITLEESNNFFANGLLTGDRYCNNLNINLK